MTGGGTGGHITPILSLARELKRQDPDCQLIYIGQKGDNIDSFATSAHNFNFTAFINAGKFRRYHGESILSHVLDFKTIVLNIRDFFRVITATSASLRILNRTKPDVLFVKGGFVCVPVGIAARLKRIPIITHDSDSIGGLANRIVGRWAHLHATGMPPKYYSYPKASIRYVGIPLDSNIKPVTPAEQTNFKRELGIGPDSIVLLVVGGSQGSKSINDRMIQIAPQLLGSNLALHILHIAGAKNFEDVKKSYSEVLPDAVKSRVETIAHTGDFYKYVGAADLVISRAGATSIAEYALAGKACVIIPSPFLAAGHQLKNANLLQIDDAAIIVNEDDPAGELRRVISELTVDDHRRWQLATNLSKLAKPDAASDLAKIVLELARN